MNSKTISVVVCANGISLISSVALSVVPSRANRPPMIRMEVDEKKAGVLDSVCVMTPSSMRGSRAVACIIQ
ncbi:hypothetical protein D9M68_1000360 [compost metagenome]